MGRYWNIVIECREEATKEGDKPLVTRAGYVITDEALTKSFVSEEKTIEYIARDTFRKVRAEHRKELKNVQKNNSHQE